MVLPLWQHCSPQAFASLNDFTRRTIDHDLPTRVKNLCQDEHPGTLRLYHDLVRFPIPLPNLDYLFAQASANGLNPCPWKGKGVGIHPGTSKAPLELQLALIQWKPRNNVFYAEPA